MTPTARLIGYYIFRFIKGAIPVSLLGRVFAGILGADEIGIFVVLVLAVVVGVLYAATGDGPEGQASPRTEPTPLENAIAEMAEKNRKLAAERKEKERKAQ